MGALDPHDIHIQIIPPPITSSTRNLFAYSTNASPNSHLLPTPDLPNNQSASTIHLDDIRVQVKVSEPEALFYSSRHLAPAEQALVSSWLSSSVPLASLRRASAQLVRQLEEAETEADLVEPLELRAQLVAEATGLRAARDAEHDVRSGARAAAAATFCRERLLREQRSVKDALAQFDIKISAFAKTDPASADLLVPARRELQERLRALTAQVAAYGGGVEGDCESMLRSITSLGSRDGSGVGPRLFVSATWDEGPLDFISNREAEIPEEEQSSVDEEDLALAVPIDSGDFTYQLPNRSSSIEGYISSNSDGENDLGNIEAPLQGSVPAGGCLGSASFVVDLDGSPVGSMTHLENIDAQGSSIRHEHNIINKTGKLVGGRVQQLLLGSHGRRVSEDTEDGSDLERSTARRRGKGRSRGRMSTNGGPILGEAQLVADEEYHGDQIFF